MEEKGGNYLAFISQQNLEDGSLSAEDIMKVQNKLWILLGQRTERFTQGDSSSVPLETAQELFKSICFSLDLYRKSHGNVGIRALLLNNDDIGASLKLGWTELEVQLEKGRGLLKKAKETALKFGNISYQDTLLELATFFRKYDFRFFAHEIPCSIDYQLCVKVPETLLGIEYISEYLRRLIVENIFCGYFDATAVVSLLRSHSTDYYEQLINIFEPIFTNALGLTLAGGDVLSLDMTGDDRQQLLESFQKWTEAEAKARLLAAADALCAKQDLCEHEAREYLRAAAAALYARIKAAADGKSFDNLFLPLCDSEIDESATVFRDGESMEDEKLRALIDELQDCRYVPDKIAMVKSSVHSIRDLVEVMEICFWDGEYTELFQAFEAAELAVLLQFLRDKYGELSEWQPEARWEQKFADYIKAREKN